MQIVVLSPPRSGASLVTRVVNMMGAGFDGGPATIGFASDAAKGFWENAEIVSTNDRILAAQDLSWRNLAGWRAGEKRRIDGAIGEEVARLAAKLGPLSVTKDPRLCLTWPFWAPHLKQAVLVLVHRSPVEVALSLKERHQMPLALGLAIWEYYTIGQLEAARQAKQVVRVAHDDVVHRPEKTVRDLLVAFAAIEPNPLQLPSDKELTGFIEPSLHRSKAPDDAADLLSAHQSHLYALARGDAALGEKTLVASLPARDAMESAETANKAESRLKRVNGELAETDQKRHELESELQSLRARSDGEIARLQATVDRYKGHLGAIQQSRSWQAGSRLARLLRWRGEPEFAS